MAVTVQAVLTRNYTSTATSFEANMTGDLPASAARLVLLFTLRAYTSGATRTITAQWNDVNVPVRQTSLLGTITAQDDVHYWIGTLDNPDLTGKNLKVAVSGSIRGFHATAFLVDGSDDTVPIIVHDFQDRDVSGNTVVLNGTPARAGSVLVNASSIADNSTIASFSPSGWTSVLSGTSTGGGNLTSHIAYIQVASTDAIETATQFGASDVNRGGVLFEIQAAVSAGSGVTESVSPSDSVGVPIVAVAVGLTEAAAATDSASGLIPADTSPENPVGVWSGAAASWKLPSGKDSKASNDLAVSGLSAATIKGPGATFATDSYARRTAPGFGSPNTAAPEFWVKPTTFGHLFYLGPRSGAGTNVCRLWIDSAGAWNMLRTIGASTQTAKSANGAAVLGTTYHVAAVFQGGENLRLHVDGEPIALTFTGAALTGGITVGSNDEIALGSPTPGSLAGFAGDMGRVTVWPIALSASRIKASYRTQNDLAQWVGISGENASSDTNRAPAAAPVQEALTGGVAKTIDVIARAYDADGDALSIQSGSLSPSTGSASVVSDQIRWTPPASFTGAATCGFTLRDGGGKSSASKVYATVAGGHQPSTDPQFAIPFASVPAAKALTVGWTGHGGAQRAYDTREAAYAAAKALGGGVHISLNDGAYSGTWTLDGTFPDADPIVIRSRNVANGHTPLAILSGQVKVNGPSHWLTELRYTYRTNQDPNGALIIGSHHTRITRNWFHTWNGVYFTDTTACHDQWLGWNRFASTRDPKVGPFQGNGAARANFIKILLNAKLITPTSRHANTKIYRNYMKDNGSTEQGDDDSHHIYIGNSKADYGAAGYISGCIIEWNLVDSGSKGHQRCFYLKRGIEYLQFNHIKAAGLFGFRHGSKTYGTDQTPTDFTGRMWGNRIGNTSYVILSGSGIDVRGNIITSPQGIRGFSGNRNGAGATVAGQYQACSDLLLAGNTVNPNGNNRPYNIGYHDTGDILDDSEGGRVRNVRILGHAGKGAGSLTITGGQNPVVFDAAHVMADTFTISDSVGDLTIPSAPTLTELDVGFQVAGQGPP